MSRTRRAPDRVLLVSVEASQEDPEGPARLAELAGLVESAGALVAGAVVQHKGGPSGLPGEGKLREIARRCTEEKIAVVVTRQSLSPSVQRRMEDALPCRVLDRTGLILDIFAMRARSREGQLQVDLAQMLYRLPRLSGKGAELSRLGGGLGTRGPGEQKLEYDRRRLRERVTRVRRELEDLRGRRGRQRDRRRDRSWPLVVLAGYTNAGKSTLFNALTGEGAVARLQMFSTLDPQVRQVRLPGGGRMLLTDTVGFIRDLPDGLRVAFRATLEEVADADAVLHVMDATHPDAEAQVASVRSELAALGVEPGRVVDVRNKTDLIGADGRPPAPPPHALPDAPPPVAVSARTGDGMRELLAALEGLLRERFWTRYVWRRPPPGLAARLLHAGASLDERAGDLAAWLTPAQAARFRPAEPEPAP